MTQTDSDADAVLAPDGFERLEGLGDYIDMVGPLWSRGEGERQVLALRIEDRHRNAAGTAHGGLLATLVDFSLGVAIGIDAETAGVATVSLTTDFLGPARPGDWVEAHTRVERVGGKLAFADCSLRVEDREVVRGRAVFAVLDGG